MRENKKTIIVKYFSVLASFFLIIAASANAQVVNVIDPAWMKTSNMAVESDAQLGTTAYPVTDPFWNWTADVWDGPAQNGFGVFIPGYVADDYWAYWPHGGGGLKESRWLTASLDVCDPELLSEVRLIKKYPGTDILSINDDLYVWVNGAPAAAGGTACPGRLPTVVEPFRSMFSCATKGGDAVETDNWLIEGGLSLPTTLFHEGNNTIEILTDELHLWGGIGHLVVKVEETDICLPPVVNDYVDFVPIPSTFQTSLDTFGCPDGFQGKFRFNAMLIGKPVIPPLTDLMAQVAVLTNGNLVKNADGGPGGVGATVTFGPIDDYSDSVLTGNESVRLPFIICMKEIKPFQFFVDVLGVVQ